MSTRDPDGLARLLRRRVTVGPMFVEVSGSSMGPRMVTGSQVEVVAAARPRWGEIWLFVGDAGDPLVHRCVGWRRGQPRFWGDGNRTIDTGVDSLRAVGRVVAIRAPSGVVRQIGGWERWGRGPFVMARHVVEYVVQRLGAMFASSRR